MKLSIIILNYNTQEYLQQLLQSIKLSNDKFKKEIIVVDNASSDQSVKLVKEKFPQVKLIISSKNLGYAAGNNLGLKQARGKYILLLNSDTKIFPQTLEIMVEFMEQNPQVGVATCRVELEDGSLDPACHRGFPTPWASLSFFLGLEKIFPQSRLFGQYHLTWKDLTSAHEIDSPAGAFYLTKKEVLKKVGLLDEQFFMYAEDLDWSLRIKNAGYKIIYVPQAKIIHYKKKSGRQKIIKGQLTQKASEIRRQTTGHFFDTMKLFYDKHYKTKYPKVIRSFVLAGIWLVSKFKD